jgi:hypothetical protein
MERRIVAESSRISVSRLIMIGVQVLMGVNLPLFRRLSHQDGIHR